jgi:GAF domain-containing protein/HAMP domain-containing protein
MILLYSYFHNQVERRAYETALQMVTEVDASQRYVREVLRPIMFELVGDEDFFPEGMSTTFVARNTVERFQEQYPDYYFKFAATNPRNPANLADDTERQIIEHFEADPTLEQWQGIIQRDGQPYLSVATPIRFDASCMQCHGDPAAAPLSLRESYGDKNGFWRQEGEVAIKSVGIPLAESMADARSRTLLAGAIAGIFLIGLSILSIFLFRSLVTQPVGALQLGAEEISKGHLDYRVATKTKDELGQLGTVFNAMAGQLAALVGTLEEGVAERTGELERHSSQLQAAAEVAREAAAIRDVRQLLDTTVSLISQRFGFYHAGIFFVDDAGEYAVLQAASSAGGQRMLARGHRLKVGEAGIVGYAAAMGEPRIALDVGRDAAQSEIAVFFDNPDLPDTHSELALPLKVRERVIGVLDVQSTKDTAFSDEDVAILQTMADQVALALENARLLADSQQALRELEASYGRQARAVWMKQAAQRPAAYRYTGGGVLPVSPPLAAESGADSSSEHSQVRMGTSPEKDGAQPSTKKDGRQLVAPIRLRGQHIGSILLRRGSEAEQWSSQEVALLEEVSTQIGLALENARLLEESRQRAAREQLLGEVTARMRETLDLDTVLKTAIREIGDALGLAKVEVRIKEEAGQPGNGPSRGEGG